MSPAVLIAALQPSESTARDWLTRELAKAEYAGSQPSPADRFWDWLQNLLSNSDGLPVRPGVLLLIGIVVVVAVVVLLVNGPARRAKRTSSATGAVFSDERLTATDHRQRAERAAGEGRWVEAVQERFRAIVRSLQERTLLDDRPGLTADEAAAEAAARFAQLAPQLRTVCALFDGVSFGDRPAERADYQQLVSLDDTLGKTRPSMVASATGDLLVPR